MPALALERPVLLSVYQGTVREGDFTANLDQVRSTTARALEQGSQFLAFPECFLSGCESRNAVQHGARALEDPELQEFIRETADHDMVLLVGMARREESRLYDSVLVIQSGRLLGVQDKLLLNSDDRSALGFTGGTGIPVFNAHGTRFSALVGSDATVLAPALLASLQGAEILFASSYEEPAQPLLDDHRKRFANSQIGIATLLRLAIARANVVKTSRPGQVGYGDSAILSPMGTALAEGGLLRAGLISATLEPDTFRTPAGLEDSGDTPEWLRTQVGRAWADYRTPREESDLRAWLKNMLIDHRYSASEASRATGLARSEVQAAARRLGVAAQRPQPRADQAPLKVLPYPGGRHPRIGFLNGAVAPHRETKASVFTPWDGGGYVVVDAPEAIFSNLGLLYLAHTHLPTIWDERGIQLPPEEWKQHEDGDLTTSRLLPNGVSFQVAVHPATEGVHMELTLRNGTPEPLSGLRVQNCVMLGHADGFASQTDTNRVLQSPFSAARSSDGRRWVITGWERCQRTWGNPWVPCIHADPVLEDCPPGGTVRVRGWISFFEGEDVRPELDRLRSAGVVGAP